MTTDQLTTWAIDHPWPTVGIIAAALAVAIVGTWAIVRTVRSWTWPPLPVLVAGAGALVCTAYSGDTSWRFAGERLGMADSTERAVMFAAGELALLACAVMARANKAATATDTTAGSAGVPGVLVWVITGVQIIPCYATSGLVGGTVRAIIGPVMAGLLWHLAMGLEIRVVRPEALSTGLPAMIGRELRERLLSRLGLATRNRTAEQITRDRATASAVRLAALLELRPDGWLAPSRRRRLATAVARSGAGTNGEQRHRLLQLLAARRNSGLLASLPVPSPWTIDALPEPYPPTPLGVTGAQLRTMDPLAAVHQVRSAHPDATPAELAALLTQYGVPVTETQVRIATRAGNPPTAKPPVEPTPTRPAISALPARGLHLDLVTTAHVHPDMLHRAAVSAATRPRAQVHARVPATPHPKATATTPATSPLPAPTPAGSDPLLARARQVDDAHLLAHNRHASVAHLRKELRVGQPAAQRLRDQLKAGS